MGINHLLVAKGLTKYRLSKDTGIAYATISDICSGKTLLANSSASTAYRIAKLLGISVEQLLETEIMGRVYGQKRSDFDVFKSNVCHRVKDIGDLKFIIEILGLNLIRKYFNMKWYPEALYLLAMVDYLSRENDLPLCTNYNDIRACKLSSVVYPSGIVMLSAATGDNRYKEESIREAIPEFLKFNIVENEVRNVY
jgi:transcriptional regulator with XRE-family HTH domain